MSAKQTKGFRFPEEKCHEVTKGDGRVTLSVWTEGARKECLVRRGHIGNKDTDKNSGRSEYPVRLTIRLTI